MKTLKCPICGSKRTFLDIIPQGYQYICTQCGLCALRQFTPQEAAEAWNELVSKFSPIMRVQVGDKLHFIDRSLKYQYWATVTDVDVNDAWIRTDKGSCRPDDVLKWPWELNRKEASND